MKIKKFKKVENLKHQDIVVLGIADQQDAGVYSDITPSNIIAIVDKVKVKDGVVTLLVNGGYEFVYNEGKLAMCIGEFTELEKDMKTLVSSFSNYSFSLKTINEMVKKYNKTVYGN